MITVLFGGRADERAAWTPALRAGLAARGVAAEVFDDPEAIAPGRVDYLVFNARGPVPDLAPYAGAKALMSTWAGVEAVLANPTLPPETPLTRMVEPGLTWGMTDYVIGHVMRAHLDIDGARARSDAGIWEEKCPPLARDRKVGVLGLGELGRDAAGMLAHLRFDVAGWSRTLREIPGVATHSGEAGLEAVLARSEILVLLLPATAATENLLDAARLALLPPGASLINPGRGTLIDDDALLAALDSGHVGHATLDVFRTEPLPADHRYWSHPRVTVTPHIASTTRAVTAVDVICDQIARGARGEALEHIVDRVRGY